MSALDVLLRSVKLEANVFQNGQYCGAWAIDTSGSQRMTFHVVAFGHCTVSIGDEAFDLQQGDAIFFPTDAKHRISALHDFESELNVAHSISMIEAQRADSTGLICGDFGHDNPIFRQILKTLPPFIVLNARHKTASSYIVDMMIIESKKTDTSSSLLLNRLSDCLLYTLLRDNVDAHRGPFAAMAHPQIAKAMDLIHNSEGHTPKLDELANVSAMSRSAFSESFRNLVGESPGDYSIKWRMTRAYRWLADMNVSTLEAALRSGYESEASFAKAFKRVMGVGPGSVRSHTYESSN
ncbi:MAG: AraC family transcriptional regulator [Acidiferrobacterales bacterium]|nr:AraC family transcriptional regulator [Acidiferrobacterales bacterium]